MRIAEHACWMWALIALGALGCGPSPIVMAPPPEPPPPPAEGPAVTQNPPGGPRPAAQVAVGASEPAPVVRVAEGACDLGPQIAALAPGCERLQGVAASGTGAQPAAFAAFDGDACSIWNAGDFPPQSATLDLGAPMTVTTVLLVPEMSPATATVEHTVEVSDDGRRFARLGQLRTVMRSGEIVELPIPGGVTTRFLRVVTSASPSWVAWRDIIVLRCGAARAR